MKFSLSILSMALALTVLAQTKPVKKASPPKEVKPRAVVDTTGKKIVVNVSFDKRITLVFPSPIKEHNFGSGEIDASYNGNKVYLQATSTKGFPESNLYVELENGLYYDCKVHYYNYLENATNLFTSEQATGNLNEVYGKKRAFYSATDVSTKDQKQTVDIEPNSDDYYKKTLLASKSSEYTPDLAVKDRKLIFSIPSIYVIDDQLYFKVRIKNLSSIAYDIHSIDFNVVPKKAVLSKDVADPEICKPKYILNEKVVTVPAKEEITRIYAFDKFTISDKKKLLVALWEKGGDREVDLTVFGNDLLKARILK